MIKFFSLVICLGIFSSFCGNNSEAVAKFGEKVKFAKNSPVKFADFTLVFTGERSVSSDVFPRGFLYQDFTIQNQTEEKTVSWTSGTGDIAPTAFQIGGSSYELELRISDKLGKLAENELVVWKNSRF